jgi:hypothetical protein
MTQADSVHSTPRTSSPSEIPAESAGALFVKTPITPEEIFQSIGRLRKAARDEIDRLVRFRANAYFTPDSGLARSYGGACERGRRRPSLISRFGP